MLEKLGEPYAQSLITNNIQIISEFLPKSIDLLWIPGLSSEYIFHTFSHTHYPYKTSYTVQIRMNARKIRPEIRC